MACGFFIVLILERLVLTCNGHGNEEMAPLLPPAGHSHSHTHRSVNDVESSSHHVHVDMQAHSSFRSFMLFLSLSLHSVFEGLAIGLQSTDTKVKNLPIYKCWLIHCRCQTKSTTSVVFKYMPMTLLQFIFMLFQNIRQGFSLIVLWDHDLFVLVWVQCFCFLAACRRQKNKRTSRFLKSDTSTNAQFSACVHLPSELTLIGWIRKLSAEQNML